MFYLFRRVLPGEVAPQSDRRLRRVLVDMQTTPLLGAPQQKVLIKFDASLEQLLCRYQHLLYPLALCYEHVLAQRLPGHA